MILIPFIIYIIVKEQYITALILLTVSGLTEILDGWIARKFNFITNFGKLIDPLADKATQLAVLLTITFKGVIPFWIIIVVALKESAMLAGASFLYGKDLVVSSKWYGKLTTVLFYIAIVSSFIIAYFNIPYRFDTYIYYLGLAKTIFSLIMYFNSFYAKGYFENFKNLKK